MILGVSLLVGLSSCSDDSEAASTGKASVAITDAAVDAENISSVNLSVSEVRATSNNETSTIVTFDSPKEFNLMAYQNGETYFLGEGDLEVGTYTDIRFIISGPTDSYIEFEDGSTEALEIPSGTTSGYKVNGTFEVAANTTSDIVADVDLRKALVLTGEGSYMLRPTARLVEVDGTGSIEGTVQGEMDAANTYVVYAYSEGTFTDSEEAEPASGSTRYEGSVNSAIVAEDGSYTLAFMEEGEYEIIVASYANTDEDEDLEFQGSVSSSLMIDGALFNLVSVSSNTTVDMNILLN